MTIKSQIQPIIESASDRDLFSIWVSTMQELRRRKILRSDNTPTGDYAEWLVSQGLGLNLQGNAQAGYDAVDSAGTKYQIKARRLATANTSRQLSALRNLDADPFDFLIAVLFGPTFEVVECWQIPLEVVKQYAVYRSHVNAHVLYARNPMLLDKRITRLVAIEDLIS